MKANHIMYAKRSGRRYRSLFLLLFVLLICVLPASAGAKYNARLRKGTYISIMGDSISTYAGWSDLRPITGLEHTYRYGEAYYGPKGGDYHNTDLLVSDTWWHQAASELGGQILVSNAANSSGLLRASYPSIPEWEHYLKDMRAYLSRPYYMGVGKVHPDIIALYIGSADVTGSPSTFGSIQDVDFSALIQKTGKNAYTYAEPATVAEAYCILLHKLQVTYPKAEIYCFTVLPNAGGKTSTINTRLKNVLPFNEMIKGVASHYGAFVVDIFDEFALDPDYDSIASDADVKTFQSFFHNDPHPNAKGFDVITRRFVSTILENSRFVVGSRKNPPAVTVTTTTDHVDVETSAGKNEAVQVNYTTESETPLARMASSVTVRTTGEAVDYLTKARNTVNYSSSSVQHTDPSGLTTGSSSSSYTSVSKDGYWAEGGTEESVENLAPGMEIVIPMDASENLPNPQTQESKHPSKPQLSGDIKTSKNDGTYDYTETQILKQGKVTITTEDIQFRKRESSSDMSYVVNQTTPTGSGENSNDMIAVAPMKLPQTKEDVPAITNTYDFVFIGSDKYSHFYAARLFTSPAGSTLAAGDPVYSGNGYTLYTRRKHSDFTSAAANAIVPKLYLDPNTTVSGNKWYPAWWDSIQQFALTDADANIIHTYCADRDTPTIEGHSYRMQNIADGDYYDAEEARMLRSVAYNGYWGAKSGLGSLASVKNLIRKSEKFSEHEINTLTDGMAMTATQYAIWSLSDRMDAVKFISAYYTAQAGDFYPVNSQAQLDHQAKVDLIFKLFFHLLDLAKDAPAPEGSTADTVITEKNFLQDVCVKLTGKPQMLEDNLDDVSSNDVYAANLSFTLGVDPLEGNKDNLVVIIEDSLGNPLVSGRIAGKRMPGEILLTPDQKDRYTFSNLQLSEGVQQLVVRIKGTQNLRKDVYLFTSEIKDDPFQEGVELVPSQTMVGVAEGDYGVNVEMNLLFTLDVEDDIFSIKRFWRKENVLPSAPQTGDSSYPMLVAVLLLCSTASVFALRRRVRRS